MEAKIRRQLALSDARRAIILAAAQRVLNRMGVEKASMREIAAEAGYAPAAIYGYFVNKQMLMGGLLDSMVSRLTLAVGQAGVPKGLPELALAAKGRVWMGYFEDNPFDRQLLLKICNSSPASDVAGSEALKIRVRMMRTLEPLLLTDSMSGLEPSVAASELESIWVYALGLLLTYGEDQECNTSPSISDRFDAYLTMLHNTHRTMSNADVPHLEQSVLQMDMFE